MVQLKCAHCGREFQAHPYDVKRGRLCCSLSCSSYHKPKIPAEIRFWKHVQKTESCWLWTGGKTGGGYGLFFLSRKRSIVAHRYAWGLKHGPIPDDLILCHDCPGGDNPACVNWDHIFLGNTQINALDAAKKGTLAMGETCHLSKLTEAQVIELWKLYHGGMRQVDIAKHLNIGTTAVWPP